MAPAVAAATFAEGVGLGSVAAFDTGGFLPRTGFILGHEKEYVASAPLTGMLNDVARNGGVTQQGARAGNTIHMPITYAPVINHPMTQDDVDDHLDYIFAGVRQRANAFNS
jgi:hypothetical protein